MQWGLIGEQLSQEHRSFSINESNSAWNSYISWKTLPTYDFYVEKHDGTVANAAGATMVHSYAGQHFTSEIFVKSINRVCKIKYNNLLSL
jgi:hypothetical protein